MAYQLDESNNRASPTASSLVNKYNGDSIRGKNGIDNCLTYRPIELTSLTLKLLSVEVNDCEKS